QRGEHVLGGVYEIDEKCLRLLDRYEGYPTNYDRMNVIVFNDMGDAIEAVMYYKKERAAELAPSPEYLAVIREGFRDWGLI
ncbi:MAG: gamma-glutamylcyclotransferase, partial [Chloroflexi bacterium]|nr:gamma-glutamylcyclotransferase [Chloroflexota bacterium]